MLYSRQKILLSLLELFGGRSQKTDFQKYVFLYTRLFEGDKKSYEFVPYKFGCFSFLIDRDKQKLTELGYLEADDKWSLTLQTNSILETLALKERAGLKRFKSEFGALKGSNLIQYVYKNYPFYAINSEIAERELTTEEYKAVQLQKPKTKTQTLFTIGYEGKELETYLNQLITNNISVLCDVRKNPISRKFGFSKTLLASSVNRLGIQYVHIPELGIESEFRTELNGPDDYKKLFDYYAKHTLPSRQAYLDKVYEILENNKRVALTCYEADSQFCHRRVVAEAVEKKYRLDKPVVHI